MTCSPAARDTLTGLRCKSPQCYMWSRPALLQRGSSTVLLNNFDRPNTLPPAALLKARHLEHLQASGEGTGGGSDLTMAHGYKTKHKVDWAGGRCCDGFTLIFRNLQKKPCLSPGAWADLPPETGSHSELTEEKAGPAAVLQQSSEGQILQKCGYYAGILFPKMGLMCRLEV